MNELECSHCHERFTVTANYVAGESCPICYDAESKLNLVSTTQPKPAQEPLGISGAQLTWQETKSEPAQESWLEGAFVKCDGSHPEDQIVDGTWRHPKWGCDSLQHLMESFNAALAAERKESLRLRQTEWESYCTTIQQLRSQLVEIQELVDAYNDTDTRPAVAVLSDIDAALAKLSDDRREEVGK